MTVKQKAIKWLVQCALVVALIASAGTASASKASWIEEIVLAVFVATKAAKAYLFGKDPEEREEKPRAEMTPAQRNITCQRRKEEARRLGLEPPNCKYIGRTHDEHGVHLKIKAMRERNAKSEAEQSETNGAAKPQ